VLGVIESAAIGSATPPLLQLLVQGCTVTEAPPFTVPPYPGAFADTVMVPPPTDKNSPEQTPFTGTAQLGACAVVTGARTLCCVFHVTCEVMFWFGITVAEPFP